jgi:hypothetical protein
MSSPTGNDLSRMRPLGGPLQLVKDLQRHDSEGTSAGNERSGKDRFEVTFAEVVLIRSPRDLGSSFMRCCRVMVTPSVSGAASTSCPSLSECPEPDS